MKLCFPRLADGIIVNLGKCFYPHVLQDLKKNKVTKDFDMRVQSDKFLRVGCMALLFLLYVEGSAVFTLREISCDSAS